MLECGLEEPTLSGRKVINADDAVTLRQQSIYHRTADEAGTAGYDDRHDTPECLNTKYFITKKLVHAVAAVEAITPQYGEAPTISTTNQAIDIVIGLRVSEEAEREGLDTTDHGERAYNY